MQESERTTPRLLEQPEIGSTQSASRKTGEDEACQKSHACFRKSLIIQALVWQNSQEIFIATSCL
jgi:hypothetical protein